MFVVIELKNFFMEIFGKRGVFMSFLLIIVMFGFVLVDRIGFEGLKLRFIDC